MNGTGTRRSAMLSLLAGAMVGRRRAAPRWRNRPGTRSTGRAGHQPAPAGTAKRDQPLPKEPGRSATRRSPERRAVRAARSRRHRLQPAGQVCAKADFEAVVDDAAGALRDLNMQNKPAFQEKLRQLKDKRGWSHDAFLKEAAPFVRDDKIAVYDQDSERLLTDISTLGQEGADAATPDCALLADLKARMQTLVDTQTAKWTYMFSKLDAALAQ